MERRNCVNASDSFCYICGIFTPDSLKKPLTKNVKAAYLHYFKCRIGDQDKKWAPHVACNPCVNHLNEWMRGKRPSGMAFGIPMVWREQKDHSTDCYFCLTNIKGYSVKTRAKIRYPDVPSAIRPVPHGPDLPVPNVPIASAISESDSNEEDNPMDTDFQEMADNREPKFISQEMLHDLARDLDLPKEKSEVLGSRLKEWNLLQEGVLITTFRRRHKELSSFFKMEHKLCYCFDVDTLMEQLCESHTYDKSEWRLFIDSGKNTLKAVLLHKGNKLPSVPIAHGHEMSETYETMKTLLSAVKYEEHQWNLCGDLKVISLLLGLQLGYTKHMCFLCLWDSRADSKHYKQKEWPARPKDSPGRFNCMYKPLVDSEKVYLPPLHLKLGLMKNFVKAMDQNGAGFQYLLAKFERTVSEAKVKAGVFNGPQIRQLLNDDDFVKSLTALEKAAWKSFLAVIKNYLGNVRASNYEELVNDMLKSYHALGARMSLKIHFFHSHLDFFPTNLGAVSDEQGERFHQDIATMETRYQGRFSPNMIGDYCWTLQRESSCSYKRKSKLQKHF